MAKKLIKCTNKNKTYDSFIHDRSDYTMCYPCHFLYTYQGESCRDDRIDCECPINVKYRDIIEYREASYKNVTKKKKKKVIKKK